MISGSVTVSAPLTLFVEMDRSKISRVSVQRSLGVIS